MSEPLILGIRHHGPGSARSALRALEAYQPDIVLIEGPTDAQELIELAAHPDMQPPVALLLYVPDEPKRAVYYPFVEFSPEWQVMRYGLERGIAVRFMDLPQTHRLALAEAESATSDTDAEVTVTAEVDESNTDAEVAVTPDAEPDREPIRHDPLGWVAEATGYGDGERWWEHMVEQRQDSSELFQGVLELMTALRAEAIDEQPNPIEQQREAWMRNSLRAAKKQGFERIAVVCGAWHAPALTKLPPAKDDNRLLKGLPKVKTTATWTPWTYGRLSAASGYGAGVEAPGFYDHLWLAPNDVGVGWLSRVAHLLRAHDLSAPPASVIEAVRLAEALSALRGRAVPDLADLTEAAQAVLCNGDAQPLALIERQLHIGERLGQTPEAAPLPPLQQDLQRQQKRLRLPAEAVQRQLELDLRKPNDRARSHLLHRLNILGVPWGKHSYASGKGTFRENWRLQWQPEFVVSLIEANVWGNTVADAAGAFARDAAQKTDQLPELTRWVERVLLADLPEALDAVMTRLQNVAAVTSDMPHLLAALPPLAHVLRYGDVRQTDASAVGQVIDGLAARVCIGLPAACSALNDEAAAAMRDDINAAQSAFALLQREDLLTAWCATLLRLADQEGLHGLLAGRCCRLLFEQGNLPVEDIARRMQLALSPAVEAGQAAAWIEGFLEGSGLVLLHHETLWQLLDEWLMTLPNETFVQLLPLLRRTFATFAPAERRQMGERAQRAPGAAAIAAVDSDYAAQRADQVLPLVVQLLGLDSAVGGGSGLDG